MELVEIQQTRHVWEILLADFILWFAGFLGNSVDDVMRDTSLTSAFTEKKMINVIMENAIKPFCKSTRLNETIQYEFIKGIKRKELMIKEIIFHTAENAIRFYILSICFQKL